MEYEDGASLHPDFLTRRFHHLVGESVLPPVRLHDLRHGAASLAHCAGVDLKTVRAQLGHVAEIVSTWFSCRCVPEGLPERPGLSWPGTRPGRRGPGRCVGR